MTDLTTCTHPVDSYTSRTEVIAMAMIRLGGLTAYTTAWYADPGATVRAILHGNCDTAAEYHDRSVMYSHVMFGGEVRYLGVDAGRKPMTPAEAAVLVRKMPRHAADNEAAIERLAGQIEKWSKMPR